MLRKYFFIPETLLGFGLFIIINFSFYKESAGFIGVSPHPFWIVILLIASRYGTIEGLFAGAVAAGLYIGAGLHSGQMQFTLDTFPHGVYLLPFLFLLIGGILGEIRNLYKKRYTKLEDRYDDTVHNLEDLGLQHIALVESKEELDKRIAFQSTTMLNLFEQINNLETLDRENLYRKIPELLRDQLNVTCASVYLVKHNKLRLKYRIGAENTNNTIPDAVELTDGMIGEVVRTKKVVTINQVYSEEDMTKFKKLNLIMSAPIMKKDGHIIGVINIEKMPFFDFNANAIRIFEMLSHWVSVVLDKALQFQHLKDKNIADDITGAYNYLYFQKRLQYEISRALRFKTALSLLLLEIDKFDAMNAKEKHNVLIVLNKIFKNTLREIDIISKYTTDATFAIILPGQNSEDSEKIIKRLTSEIDELKLHPFENKMEILSLNVGLSTLQLTEGSYESLVESAEERLRQGGEREIPNFYNDLAFLLKNDSTDENAAMQTNKEK